MLILSRKINQKIRIGDCENKAIITIVDVSPEGEVKLGIEAEKTIPIWRLEIDQNQGAHP